MSAALSNVADKSWQFLNAHQCRFECMLDTLSVLPVPRVELEDVRRWFGDVKEFPDIDLLMQIVGRGAPVPVAGQGDLTSALEYGNHSSVHRYAPQIREKIVEDVSAGRAFVFPREQALHIPGIRVSPLTVSVSPTKVRICHDLTNAVSGSSVNEDTDSSVFPECKIGHVFRAVLWRILFLHSKFVVGKVDPPRILLAKIDTKAAFRQVCIDAARAPVFAYVFEDVVVVDRCLQFGWTSSPSVWGVCAAAVEHAHNRTTFRNAEISPEAREITSHVEIVPPRDGEARAALPPECEYPPGSGGGLGDPFVVNTFVDDALLAEVEIGVLDGRRCLRATRSYVSDSLRLFGSRNAGEPPLFSRGKITSWDTRAEMLGWSIDTMSMTIAVPQEKISRLRVMLDQWPGERTTASVKDVRSLLGKLLHLCEVVRPGKFFIRRILNQLGLAPLKEGERDGGAVAGARQMRRVVRLGREFHADLDFWRVILAMSTGPDGVTRLEAPLFTSFLQLPSRIIISDASGDAMGGYCLETGWWWRIDFTEDVRMRLRRRVCQRDDLSMNVFELLGMVVTAWALTVHVGDSPEYPGQSVLMRGDNMSAVHWVNKCRGAREPRSGALMRMLGCLEMRNGWRFRAKHIKGVANTLADGISRWPHDEIETNLRSYRPDIRWQERPLGPEAWGLTSDVLASSSSDDQLRSRLDAVTRRLSGLGARSGD